MSLTVIKDWIWVIITLGGLFVTAIGYTYTVRNQIKEILREVSVLNKRVDKAETENSKTHEILTEIKVQISALETTIKLYFENK